MSYQNLKAELRRVGATYGDAANLLGMTRENFGLKVNGKVPFTVPEITTVRDGLMPAGHDMFGVMQIIRRQLTRTDAEGHKANKGHDFLGSIGLIYAKLCEIAKAIKEK